MVHDMLRVQALWTTLGPRQHHRITLRGLSGLHHRCGDRGGRRHSPVHSLMGEFVDVRREGSVARIVMHRNGLNAIAEELMEELASAFGEVGDDPAVRVVVLASDYEKYFSVAAGLGMLGSIDRSSADAAEQVGAFMKRMNDHFSAIERCPKPVIAAINGHALGGGSELT